MGNGVIFNCLLSQSMQQCCVIYMSGVVSTGKDSELLGQMAQAPVILIDIAKFPFLGVVAFCNPKRKHERYCFPTTLFSNIKQTT